MMVDFTEAARQRMNVYLSSVRSTLKGHASLDPEDVACDIQQHIESELATASQPVDFASMNRVIAQLGDPVQWVGSDDLPIWRRAMMYVNQQGRLWWSALAAFMLLFIAALVLATGGGELFGVAAVLAVASFLLCRLVVSLSADTGKPLGAMKWLVYPGLVLMYLCVLVLMLIGPGMLGAAFSYEFYIWEIMSNEDRQLMTRFSEFLLMGGGVAVASGLGLLVYAMFLLFGMRVVRYVFLPFAGRVGRGWGVPAILLGLLGIVGGVIAFNYGMTNPVEPEWFVRHF